MRPWVPFAALILIGSWFFPLIFRVPAWAQAGAKADAKKAEPKKAESKKSQKPDKSKKKKDDADEFNPNKIEFDKLKEAFQAEKTKESHERTETIYKFGEFPTSQTADFLLEVIREEKDKPGIVGAAVKALGKLGNRQSTEVIVVEALPILLNDVNFDFVTAALTTDMDDEAEEWLLKYGLSDAVRKEPLSLKLMVKAISVRRSPRRMGILQAELKKKTSTPELKAIILNSFRETKPKDAAKLARPFMRDASLPVQIAALEALLALEANSFSREYLPLLKNQNWQVRALAIDLLVMSDHPELAHLMEPLLLADPDYRVRVGAVQALVAVGGDAVINPLIKGLAKNEARVLDDISDALARLTGKDFGPNAVQWESWWSTNKGKVEIAKKPAEEFSAIKQAKSEELTASYFGMRVLSRNVAFIIDSSASMNEGYEAPGFKPAEAPKSTKTTAKKDSEADEKVKAAKKNLTPKIDVAKRELTKLAEKLPSETQMNLIRFNSLIEPWKPELTKLDIGAKAELLAFIQASRPEGLTNLFGALEEAFKDEKVDTIYLLTDGAPTLGTRETPEILEAIAKMNQVRKVKINTIGFHLVPEERELLEKLADANYGVFLSR